MMAVPWAKRALRFRDNTDDARRQDWIYRHLTIGMTDIRETSVSAVIIKICSITGTLIYDSSRHSCKGQQMLPPAELGNDASLVYLPHRCPIAMRYRTTLVPLVRYEKEVIHGVI